MGNKNEVLDELEGKIDETSETNDTSDSSDSSTDNDGVHDSDSGSDDTTGDSVTDSTEVASDEPVNIVDLYTNGDIDKVRDIINQKVVQAVADSMSGNTEESTED